MIRADESDDDIKEMEWDVSECGSGEIVQSLFFVA